MKTKILLVLALCLTGCREPLDKHIVAQNSADNEKAVLKCKSELSEDDYRYFIEAYSVLFRRLGQGCTAEEKNELVMYWTDGMTPRQIIITGHILKINELEESLHRTDRAVSDTPEVVRGQKDVARVIIEAYLNRGPKYQQPHLIKVDLAPEAKK